MKPRFRVSYEGFSNTISRDFVPFIDLSILGISLFYIGYYGSSWGKHIDKKIEIILFGFGFNIGVDNY